MGGHHPSAPMVFRDLYRGIITYGRTRTERRAGKERMVKVSDGWITVEQPDLRIIDEDLWNRAHGRLARTRETHPGHRRPNGQLVGRPEGGLISQHLLTGFLRCGSCGGGMFCSPRTRPNGKVLKYWLCTNHHKLGSRACANKFTVTPDVGAGRLLGGEYVGEAVLGPLMGRLELETPSNSLRIP